MAQQKEPNIWETSAFVTCLCDPYLDGKKSLLKIEGEVDRFKVSAKIFSHFFDSKPRLEKWKKQVLPKLKVFETVLQIFEGAESDKGKFENSLKRFKEQVIKLIVKRKPGEFYLIPGGWHCSVGSGSMGIVHLIGYNKDSDTYTFITCNAGISSGLSYHASKPVADPTDQHKGCKIKYNTCLRIDNIPSEKMEDLSFWSLLFTLQLGKASEYHRHEVVYDVLLPWLTKSQTLAEAIKNQNGVVDWRTPQRADVSSYWRSTWEGIRYILRQEGQSRQDMKELSFILRCEMLILGLENIQKLNNSPPQNRDNAAIGLDERILLQLGCKTVSHAALKMKLTDEQVEEVKGLVKQVHGALEKNGQLFSEPSTESNDEDYIVDASKACSISESDVLSHTTFSNLKLENEDVEKYAGLAKDAHLKGTVLNLLQMPTERVETVEDAVAALVQCENLCKNLLGRTNHSFSSRVALELTVSNLICTFFTQVLSIPEPLESLRFDTNNSSLKTCIWSSFPSKDLQLTCLGLIHKLTIIYANIWQTQDTTTRAQDSERAVVVACMMAIFDRVLRDTSQDLELAQLLGEDGGYCLSQNLCVANIEYKRVSATMELHSPTLAYARSKCMEYLTSLQKLCAFKDLFIFRMPTDKIEMKKHGTSIVFLRKVMERFGYELYPRENPFPPPEIEAIMEWMTSPSTPLAREHKEFSMLRDMALMFKYLSTMESRESELMRQRMAVNEMMSWSLSFEEDSASSLNSGSSLTSRGVAMMHRRRGNASSFLLNRALRWEVLNYRGSDMDTADVQVTCFGDRTVYFGEGLVVHSPADPCKIIEQKTSSTGSTEEPIRPTEDDILHADVLPNFDDTLSRQESEMLFSYMTVPYMRIPLVLGFFSSGDRVTYLFNKELQALLLAVLFDSSDWVPPTSDTEPEEKLDVVPIASRFLSGGNRMVLEKDGTVAGESQGDNVKLIGTTYGLLENELKFAPKATLDPLLKMLRTIDDFAEASVYSPDAALILFLIKLAVDVQSFLVNKEDDIANALDDFLYKKAKAILTGWLNEAREQSDTETCCVINSYLTLIWCHILPEKLTSSIVIQILGSMMYVRNWHCFGVGSETAWNNLKQDPTASPESRLIRFMQAHGVDTSRVGPGGLSKYLGQNRPLYLRIGAKTYRVPSLYNPDQAKSSGTNAEGKIVSTAANSRLLVSLPESSLFEMLQKQRRSLVGFLDTLASNAPDLFNKTMKGIVKLALMGSKSLDEHNSIYEGTEWKVDGPGQYVARSVELTVDLQEAQVRWRNDSLRPLPDEMQHFADFRLLFEKQQLHCGLVVNQQHRLWVHLVGTDCDLIQWDEPDDKDQGVGCPKSMDDSPSPNENHPPGDTSNSNNSLFWTCSICTFMNSSVTGAEFELCDMCQSPRGQQVSAPQAEEKTQSNETAEEEIPGPSSIKYQDVVYNRHLNPFAKDPVENIDKESEMWLAKLVVPMFRVLYKDKMPYKLLLAEEKTDKSTNKVTIMACAQTEIEEEEDEDQSFGVPRAPPMGMGMPFGRPEPKKVTVTTWKEIIVYRDRSLVLMFNLVSHGRKMYKQLIFSSNSKLALSPLPVNKRLQKAVGDVKTVVPKEPSLVISRTNQSTNMEEEFVASRLLRGVIPSAILEAYRFWYSADDGTLYGEPLSRESAWFYYDIKILANKTILRTKRKQANRKRRVKRLSATDNRKRRGHFAVSDESSVSKENTNKVEIDESTVLNLCALGFTPQACRLALSKCGNSASLAAEWLLNPDNAVLIASASEGTLQENLNSDEDKKDVFYKVIHHGTVGVRTAPVDNVESGPITNVVDTLGFGMTVQVLETAGYWLRILMPGERESSDASAGGNRHNWVLSADPAKGEVFLEQVDVDMVSNAHDETDSPSAMAAEMEVAIAKSMENNEKDMDDSSSTGMSDIDTGDEDTMVLVDLLEGPEGDGPLFQLVSTLTVIEDLSHILAWKAKNSNEIVLIEMPRLKLRFRPGKDDSKLHLVDHTGWYVCKATKTSKALLDAHCLLLENFASEMQLLVPNHVLSRPALSGRPFSTDVSCDRGSEEWISTMDTRFYIYPIHTSKTFLKSNDLGASLYLVLIKFLQRRYHEVCQLIDTCSSDIPFSVDENFIWKQFENTLDDRHPDAHACRLLLSLGVMYSRKHNRTKWKIHEEYDAYLSKLPRVSGACRLSTTFQEPSLAKICTEGTARIKNRLACFASTGTNATVRLKAPRPRVGGHPWQKLCAQSIEYMNKHSKTIKRIHYRNDPPKSLLEIIMQDFLIADEESGANRQLGFAFLYDLLLSSSSDSAMPPDGLLSNRTAGELLTRYFHLKMSRWGRETLAEGEQESSNSRQMAQLAALMTQPNRPWASVPRDSESVSLMKRGLNLYDETGRHSMVKTWIDMIDVEFSQAWAEISSAQRSVSPDLDGYMIECPNPLLPSNETVAVGDKFSPAMVCDTGCKKRTITNETIADWASRPLKELWEEFIVNVEVNEELPTVVPFDISNHQAAQSEVAKDIISRLSKDVKKYSDMKSKYTKPVLKDTKMDSLRRLMQKLVAMKISDAKLVSSSIQEIVCKVNIFGGSSKRFCSDLELEKLAGSRDVIDFRILTKAILSQNYVADLKRTNPTLTEDDINGIMDDCLLVMFHCSRLSLINRTIELLHKAMSLSSLDGESDEIKSKLRTQVVDATAASLCTCRYFLHQGDGSTVGFDPRYLVFEYIFDLMLRKRQVDIVKEFVTDMDMNRSRVQQMIMGAGKTTVVGPLLTLMLADGNTLITQVMPTALLEQSRQILRTRFSCIITKKVFTLEFDRSLEDLEEIPRLLLEKLEYAKRNRAVLCSSPEAIKSLFLKFIEHMYALDNVDVELLKPSKTQSKRQNKELTRIRDAMQAKSDMSDALVPILDLWKNGILIMDEVDVLLHPLRSELNFPIGTKDPIDMAGHRWDLPIFLIDCIFDAAEESGEGSKLDSDAAHLAAALDKGYASHALQRNPHLVLLDPSFYYKHMMPLVAARAVVWLKDAMKSLVAADSTSENDILDYLLADDLLKDISGTLTHSIGEHMKLLNLARNWVKVLLPHILSKIDRVSFGILREADLARIDLTKTPLSRRLMSVPFVGKDVPSRSSEFAHPDVVIGLTVLGFRYEGLRMRDLKSVVTQLKADFTRQVGPTDQRAASLLFRSWVELGRTKEEIENNQLPVLPLPFFQVNDPKQLHRLYTRVKKLPQVIHYYLRQHVFPATMNFQSLKVSAAGHELGSSLLFSRRIGFSGTPSNLLPLDLGECLYEPGSDGTILHVLSSPKVVTAERKENWTAKSLLRDIAANKEYNVLIDTGALITGMDNEQVARYLMPYLDETKFEGIVFLDRSDRKMFLQRSSGRCLHLAQCGVDPSKRFTFYDQVHTTGMDIHQSPDAKAVLTLGKDMTFRDYAQGAYRMRGIGKGQTIHLYLIPEVEKLICNELGKDSLGDYTSVQLDVPAWLLINSMRMESLQFVQLSVQELHNHWRKKSLTSLIEDCRKNSPNAISSTCLTSPIETKENDSNLSNTINSQEKYTKRILRFKTGSPFQEWGRKCVSLFMIPVGFDLPNQLPEAHPFVAKVNELIDDNTHFTADHNLVNKIQMRIKNVSQVSSLSTDESLTAEVVHENEQEAQEEAEEEAEEEQQKVSAFTRDDEQPNPWNVDNLNKYPSCKTDGEEAFYSLNSFQVRSSQPKLCFPVDQLVSDNFFRPRWIGMGDRKLKNATILMEWLPPHSENKDTCRFFVCVSLAEAETLRRILHSKQATGLNPYALRNVEDGAVIDSSQNFRCEGNQEKRTLTTLACVKFLNNNMFFKDDELDLLLEALSDSPVDQRLHFFEDCLRLRQRERHLWGDTPLAKVFTDSSEWHLIKSKSILQQVTAAFNRAISRRSSPIDPVEYFSRADEDNDGALTYTQLQRLLESMNLGFSAADVSVAIRLADANHDNKVDWDEFVSTFRIPQAIINKNRDEDVIDMDAERENSRWQCSNCTYINFAYDVQCEICGYGWNGQIHVPNDKWMCDPSFGGCTFFNPKGHFYCDICNKSRPDLATIRF